MAVVEASTHHTLAVTLWIVGALVVLAVLAALLGRFLIRRGIREPFVVRLINRTSDRVVDTIKRPVTIAVLDQVAEVLQAGHYTHNIAMALQENREQIKQMVADKIMEDPAAGRVHLLPGHDKLIEAVSETTLRVLLEVLGDPRMDELVSDLVRDNVNQIRQALREGAAD